MLGATRERQPHRRGIPPSDGIPGYQRPVPLVTLQGEKVGFGTGLRRLHVAKAGFGTGLHVAKAGFGTGLRRLHVAKAGLHVAKAGFGMGLHGAKVGLDGLETWCRRCCTWPQHLGEFCRSLVDFNERRCFMESCVLLVSICSATVERDSQT